MSPGGDRLGHRLTCLLCLAQPLGGSRGPGLAAVYFLQFLQSKPLACSGELPVPPPARWPSDQKYGSPRVCLLLLNSSSWMVDSRKTPQRDRRHLENTWADVPDTGDATTGDWDTRLSQERLGSKPRFPPWNGRNGWSLICQERWESEEGLGAHSYSSTCVAPAPGAISNHTWARKDSQPYTYRMCPPPPPG